MISRIKRIARKLSPGLYARHVSHCNNKRRQRVTALMTQSGPACPLDDESLFKALQQRPPPPLEYGYDTFSCWNRGVQRATVLLESSGLVKPGASILEAACGDGMTAHALTAFGHTVTLLDLEDWRDTRAKKLPFTTQDLCGSLPFEDDSFDLVYSYNAFEHVADPPSVLSELLRVCRPHGQVHLDFDPLYPSPWGLHAWRTLRMPYPQFLFSEAFLEDKLQQLGLYDLGRKMNMLQPLNKWRVDDFRRLWNNCGARVEQCKESRDEQYLCVVEQYPLAFRGRGLTLDDLAVSGIRVVLRKGY